MDYSKFDAIATQVDEDEKQEKQQRREANQREYYKTQVEQQIKHQSTHTHTHNDTTVKPYKPRCGCSFTGSVEEIKQLEHDAKHAAEHAIPINDKNQAKLNALQQLRQHGKHLYTQQQYSDAHSVYEQGLLIVHGTYDLTDAQQKQCDEYEITFYLNMAQCKLKLNEYQHCIQYCNTVQQLDANNIKTLYRAALAYIGLLEFDTALQYCNKVLTIDSHNIDTKQLITRIHTMQQATNEKEKLYQKRMMDKLQQQQQTDEEKQNG